MREIRIIDGYPGDTVKQTVTDVATGFAAAILTGKQDVDGKTVPMVGASIYIETNAVRFAFGVDPTDDTGTPIGQKIAAGGFIELKSGDECTRFKIINATIASAAILQINPFYEREVV